MKKLFLITSILMLVLVLSSVCFAERESTSGRVSNASGKSEYMEEEEETTTSRGTSYGTRPSTDRGTSYGTRPSTDSGTSSGRPTTGSTVSRPSTTTTSSTQLELIEVTISDILVGRPLPSSFKAKTNLDGSVEQTFQIGTESNGILGEWDPAITTTATQNTEYTFNLKVTVPSTVTESSDFKAKINGNICTFTRYGTRASYYYRTSYTFKTGTVTTRPATVGEGSRPDSSKEITEIKFTINAPEYGKELDRNPVPVTEGIEFDHIYWEAKDITPAGGWVGQNNDGLKVEHETDYRATIYFKIKDGYTIKDVKSYPTTVKTGAVNDETGLEVTYLTVQPHNIKTQAFAVTKSTFVRPSNPDSSGRRPTTTSGDVAKSGDVKTEVKYTIDFNTNGGSKIDSIEVKENETIKKPTDPTKEGYKFAGWYSDKNLKKEFDFNTKIDDDYTLYAKWEEEEKVEKIIWTSAHDWAIDELNKANDAGLIPTIFNKEDLTKNVTRKEFAHIAVKLYEKLTGKKAEKPSKNPFTDTTDEEVQKAYNVGITEGTDKEKGLFSPDREITREQMATMMARALKEAGVDTEVDLTKVKEFSDDNQMHNWSRNAIYFMAEAEIIKGVDQKEYRYGVTGTATREQSLLVSIRSAEKFAKK